MRPPHKQEHAQAYTFDMEIATSNLVCISTIKVTST